MRVAVASDIDGAASADLASSTLQDDRRVVARDGALAMTGSIFAAIAGFALTLVIGRLFGAHISGIYFMAVSVYMILNGVALVGSDTGIVRSLAASRALGENQRAWSTVKVVLLPVLLWSVVLAVALLLFADRIAREVAPSDVGRARLYLDVIAVTMLLSAAGQACLCGTRAIGSLRPYVLLYQFFLPAGRVLGAVLLAQAGASPRWLMWTWALPMIAMDIFAMWYVVARTRRAAEREPGPAAAQWRTVFRQEWSFNVPRGMSKVFELGLVWADVLIVGVILGPAVAGAYAAASRFITSGTMAMEALTLGTSPMFAAAFARGERDRVQSIYAMSSVWLVLLSWPVMISLATFSPWVMSLLGDDFGVAATGMTVMALAVLGYIAMGNITSLLLMAGRSKATAVISGVCLVLNIALNLLLVPPFGLVGAAVAWSVALTAQSLSGMLLGHRVLGGLMSPLRELGLAGAVTLVAWGSTGLVVRLVGEQTIGWVLAYFVCSLMLYLGVLRIFRGPLDLEDLAKLLRRRRAAA